MPPPVPPYGIFLISMVVSLLTTTIVLGTFASNTALGMRPLSAGLLALGARRADIARILLYQCSYVAALSLLSGALVSVIAVGAIVLATPDSQLHIPWPIYALTLATTTISILTATTIGNRRLHQSERLVTV